MEPSLRDRLTKILIDSRLLTSDDIAKAVDTQKERGGALSDILVSLGLISKEKLVELLSQSLCIPPIDLSRLRIGPDILQVIPEKIAKHYQILPVSKIGDLLTIVMADPMNIFAIDEIKSLTGLKVSTLIASENDIKDALRRHYAKDAALAMDRIVDGIVSSHDVSPVEAPDDSSAESASELLKITQEAPIVKFTNMLLAEGVRSGSSDILIEPLENQMRVRLRIDGVLREWKRQPKSMHRAIASRLKVMAELNIAERRLPQDGRFKIKLHGREVDFRISVLPSSEGERVALRVLDKAQAMLDIERLGFDSGILADLKKLSSRPHGMILVCGPTGCGKTTTLYSLLKYVDSPVKNIVTVEDPVEYLLEGINQVSARPDIGLTFSAALRSILRQDPNIIMIGEIRDRETVDIAIKSALTGHLVLSTLHTTTASGSIVRLLDMGIEPFLISASLIMVLAQRLVRKICPNCREPQKIDEGVFEALDLKLPRAKTAIYHGKGCEACFGTGYRGRMGMAESLILTPKIRELIVRGAQDHEIRDAARAEGAAGLRDNGIKAVLDGATTIDEVLRVTVGEQDVELK